MSDLLVCGDLVPTAVTAAAFGSGDTAPLFGGVLTLFNRADEVVINLECALTDTNYPIHKRGPNLKGSVETAQTLRKAGVTCCSLANNHVFDYGETGLSDTIRHLEAEGLRWFGAGDNDEESRKPLYLEVSGKRIAILSYNEHEYTYAQLRHPGVNPFDPFKAAIDIVNVRQSCDHLIIMYHGGKELCRYPSPRLYTACHSMAELGADIILCQHSHIIGCRERYHGCEIVYGTGNFHFVQHEDDDGWAEGLVARVNIGGNWDIDYLPVVQNETGIDLADGTIGASILNAFEKRSESLQDGSWLNGWRAFCTTVKPQYEDAVRNAMHPDETGQARELFAHYLDCEAHTDVLRILYQTSHMRRSM